MPKPQQPVRGRNTPVPTKSVASSKSSNAAPDWEAVLSGLQSGIGGEFFFVKSPKTRVRLLCFEEDLTHFFAPATTSYQGREKTKYVVFAKVIETAGQGAKPLSDEWKGKVAPLVITKTALNGILGVLSEGYDLFDEEEGYGVTIIRSGSGTDTDYTVMPSQGPVRVDLSKMEMPEGSVFDYAQKLTEKNASRNGRNGAAPREDEGEF